MYPVQTGEVPPCQKVVVVIAGLVVLVLSGWLLWSRETLIDLSQQQLALNVELGAMNEVSDFSKTELTEKGPYSNELLGVMNIINAADQAYLDQLTNNTELRKETERWSKYNEVLRNLFYDYSRLFTVKGKLREKYNFFLYRVSNETLDEELLSDKKVLKFKDNYDQFKGAGKPRVVRNDDTIVWVSGTPGPTPAEFMETLKKRQGAKLTTWVVVKQSLIRPSEKK